MEWKKRFAATTLTSYGNTAVRMVSGLVIFRTLFSNWNEQEFGFWAFLWSVLAFGILLDFGLGMTIQKTVASRKDEGDIAGINRVVSTVFWSFTGVALVILLLSWVMRGYLFSVINVPVEYEARFTIVYYLFFLGVAGSFPLGIYNEVLAGIQRVDLCNSIQITTTTINTICVLSLLYTGKGMEYVMGASSALLVLAAGLHAIVSHRCLPGLSLHPRHFAIEEVGARLKFSLSAYLIVFSGIVLTKTDQAVLAGVIGLGAVTLYQAGTKVSEILHMFASQSENLISPAAANLHSKDNRPALIELLLNNSRFLFTLTTPCYVLAAVYMEDLICLLTGKPSLPSEILITGQILLLAVYIAKISSSCGRRVMVMCGMETQLLRYSLAQATLNVVLSIALAKTFGVIGVAAATLVTSATFGLFVFLPTLKRFTEVSTHEYIAYHFRGNVLGITVLSALLLFVAFAAPSTGQIGIVGLIWRGCLVALPYMACNFRMIRSTWTHSPA